MNRGAPESVVAPLSDTVDMRAASISRDVLDSLLEGCQVIGFDFRYLYVNDLAAAQGRRPKEELLGRTMTECYPGIDQTPMFSLLERSMAERTHEQMENEFTFPDGTRIVFELRFVPVPQGVCILSLDITERRHRLAAIVDDSDDAIIGRTLDGIVTSWNKSAERIFGFSATETIGRRLELVPDEAVEAALLARLVDGEHIGHFETARTRRDGERVEVSVTLSPVRDGRGNIIGVSEIARDVTESTATRLELVRAKEAAEAANRELESFSYSVAHDLRAPLRSIDGFSQALVEDYTEVLDDDGRKYLRYVRESAQLMAELIEDMLTLSRVARSELRRERLDLSELARAACARLSRHAPDRKIEIVIPEGLEGEGDSRLLSVVFDNLFANAFKFTSKRAVAHIELGVEPGSTPAFFVRDNGAGFDMAYAGKLFGVFQRLHTAHEFEGTGVGLATVQRIIHRHGGRVWAAGEIDSGATFYFTLSNTEHIS
jgi:PAS domain S-box-containing protein